MSMRKTTLAPGQLLRSVHMEKSYLGKAGYPVLYNGKFFECEGRVKPGLTYPELLFSLNEEKMILEESLRTSCLLKMSRSILDYKYGGYLILRFRSDIDF